MEREDRMSRLDLTIMRAHSGSRGRAFPLKQLLSICRTGRPLSRWKEQSRGAGATAFRVRVINSFVPPPPPASVYIHSGRPSSPPLVLSHPPSPPPRSAPFPPPGCSPRPPRPLAPPSPRDAFNVLQCRSGPQWVKLASTGHLPGVWKYLQEFQIEFNAEGEGEACVVACVVRYRSQKPHRVSPRARFTRRYARHEPCIFTFFFSFPSSRPPIAPSPSVLSLDLPRFVNTEYAFRIEILPFWRRF